MKGYLDRIEENKLAVILVEDLNREFFVPIQELPEGSKPQTWFDLVIVQDNITSIHINHEATTSEQEKVSNMLAKLRSKSKASKFKRKK
ncbi:DUF3006 domain-containing protein [Bacillus sp. V3B]|uniref:DUF3006 domain-containing protein n=1 Tax=Bacillus sp. V3B TaxID=2804915 RepID=UPI0021094176|nr:DUF3006 domain-containing protein [Bacillus sp. V3B]MCQ6276579.1 DUF3006 domain-containing protein [Bacillus sp. V3B]